MCRVQLGHDNPRWDVPDTTGTWRAEAGSVGCGWDVSSRGGMCRMLPGHAELRQGVSDAARK